MRMFILTAIVLASTAMPIEAQPAMKQTDDLVVSTGEGVVKRAPDQAFVTIAAESRARAPREAQQQNAKTMTAVRERLAQFTLPADAIRTLSLDLQPEFDWSDGKQTLRGYLASNVIEVRLDDVNIVGEVVDAGVAAGAARVTNIRFTLKDMTAAGREALRLASEDALGRARALAQGVGRNVDRVVRLDETGRVRPEPPMPMMMRSAEMAADKTTPVSAGEVEVRVSVTLTATLR